LPCPAFSAVFPVSGHGLSAARQKHSHPVHIVSQVPEPDFYPRSGKAYGSQNQVSGFLRLHSENVFNSGSNPGTGLIALLLNFCQFAMAASFTLQVFTKTMFFQTLQTVFGPIEVGRQ